MAINSQLAFYAAKFIASIGINTHLAETNSPYSSTATVKQDLAYLGIVNIRNSAPSLTSLPAKTTALNQLAAAGIKFDLLVDPLDADLPGEIGQLNDLENTSPSSIRAIEGPNEIDYTPVTDPGLTGQAAATAMQKHLYNLVKADSSLAGVPVYDFTDGLAAPVTPSGIMTKQANGSYILINGITGWPVSLPVGVSTISVTYSGANPGAGLFSYPGSGEETDLVYGANGKLTFTFNNTGNTPLQTYVTVAAWNVTTTITGVSAVSGKSANLVTFDPNFSLAGLADYANIHPYTNSAQPGAAIPTIYQRDFGSATPGPRVITEDGYTTDPNFPNGVTELVQAQSDVKILLDGYSSGASMTYLYELLDEQADPKNTNNQDHYGLFNNDNTPKLAATAIHNLTSILADTGSTAGAFKPGTLAWSATNLPTTAKTMLMEKSNGAFELAIWNEPVTEALATVTFNLGATYQTVKVYDPITHSVPSVTYTDVSQISVNLRDNALIIEVEPEKAAAKASGNVINAPITMAAVGASELMSFAASPVATPVALTARQIFAPTTAQDSAAEAASLSLWHTGRQVVSLVETGGGGFWAQGMHQFTTQSSTILGSATQNEVTMLNATRVALPSVSRATLF